MMTHEMTVALFDGFGGPEVLKPGRRPVPQPAPGEILVAIAAAGVNRPDVLQRLGAYPPPAGAPDWPGLEFAGTVAALGEGAMRYKLGDPVMALVAGGGYAEYAVVAETNALPVPEGLSLEEAAGIPETFFTVWHNVFQRGGLKEGESFLVHGGTSGIGTTAIQLAKAFGARVFATAGSDDKCRAAEELGAELCVNYRSGDFVAALSEATGGRGINLVLDMVGGDYTNKNLKLAAEDGRIVQIAFLNGPKVEIDLNLVMRKRLTLTGSTLRARSVGFKAGIAQELEAKVWPLLAAGTVRPLIEARYPLAEAAEAHRHMDEDHIGKIVLTT
ncbi:NAD(P)H-quinone oxidoreductase [Aurantimonas endophytica]|uniref:Putative PIG3 family NAD(P)H quinone oxidoreductase n=1 Tax=Aurantimonas endophytica TaxID=1522175 RepID=A0A7W6MQI6_9HYPH|nr:NAD(P)H-quinone oxidoreductase [Aurantimonas endophytica]MBB4003979.1 putative PIG3 family NAD(P)H quinone oxidoreductase [Aurantimonas endophytica]MCO6404829.1 zinc-binding dehydrogenase [Aurantimonas endophytica]